MPNFVKYLVTVDTSSGATVKVERIGSTGDLVEVPSGELPACTTLGGPQTVIVNVMMGGGGAPSTSSPPRASEPPRAAAPPRADEAKAEPPRPAEPPRAAAPPRADDET